MIVFFSLSLSSESVSLNKESSVFVDAFKEEEKLIRIFSTIYVEKASHKKIIIGKSGAMLKKVGIDVPAPA